MPIYFNKKYIFKRNLFFSFKKWKSLSLRYFILLIAGIISFNSVNAQLAIDGSYIKKFEKENDVEVYTGVTKTSFRFRDFSNDNFISQHKLFANTSASEGFAIDYNWLSLTFSKNIPNTSVAKQQTSIRAVGIHLRKTYQKFLLEAGTDKYRGLILQVNRRQREFEYYDDINYRSYFTRITYIFNAGTPHLQLSNCLILLKSML